MSGSLAGISTWQTVCVAVAVTGFVSVAMVVRSSIAADWSGSAPGRRGRRSGAYAHWNVCTSAGLRPGPAPRDPDTLAIGVEPGRHGVRAGKTSSDDEPLLQHQPSHLAPGGHHRAPPALPGAGPGPGGRGRRSLPGARPLLGAALAYTVSPIDLVPGHHPCGGAAGRPGRAPAGGQAGPGRPVRRRRPTASWPDAGLSAAVVEDDVAAVQGAASWIIGQTAAAGMRAVSGGLRALAGVSRRASPSSPPAAPGV